jgi:hypothetical protein
VAGVALLANAAVSVLDMAVTGSREPRQMSVSIVVSTIIGASLLGNRRTTVIVARFAMVLAAVVFMVIHLAGGDRVSALIHLLFSLALAGLLFGVPGRVRTRGALALIGCCLGARAVDATAHMTGIGPVAAMVDQASTSIAAHRPATPMLRGNEIDYTLRIPGDRWLKWNPSSAREQNPAADHWLSHTTLDGQIVIIEETIPDSVTVGFDLLVETVLDNARSAATTFAVIERADTLLSRGVQKTRLVTQAIVDTVDLTYVYGIFVGQDFALQIVCLCRTAVYERLGDDFRALIESVVVGGVPEEG